MLLRVNEPEDIQYLLQSDNVGHYLVRHPLNLSREPKLIQYRYQCFPRLRSAILPAGHVDLGLILLARCRS